MNISPISFGTGNYAPKAFVPLHDYDGEVAFEDYCDPSEAEAEANLMARDFESDGLSGFAHRDEYGAWPSHELLTVPLDKHAEAEIAKQEMAQEAARNLLEDYLPRIHPAYEEVVRMRHGIGTPAMTNAEIAKEIGVSESTVSKRYADGLAALIKMMAPERYEDLYCVKGPAHPSFCKEG